jgi:hypothetical protein
MSYQGIIDNLTKQRRLGGIEAGVLRELNLNTAYDYCSRVSVAGFMDSIGDTFIDVGGEFNYDTPGAKLSCVSTSTEDSITGTGIRIIYLEGLDTDYNEIDDVVVLNGTTPVLTTQTFLRLKRIRLIQTGSNKVAAGDITLTGDGFTWAEIVTGEYIPLLGRYTVPAGHTLVLTNTSFAAGANGDFEIMLMLRSPSLAEQTATRLLVRRNSMVYPNIAAIPEKTDLWFKVRQSGGGGDLLTVGLEGIQFNLTETSEAIL